MNKTMGRKDSADCKQLYGIADRMLSTGQYVTYADILKEFHVQRGEEVCQKQSADDYSAPLKQWVSRLNGDNVFEYKNGKDAREGLRYKEGMRNYWFLQEMKVLSKAYYQDRKSLLLIDGLPLMEDDATTCPIVQLDSCSLKTIEGESVLGLVKVFFRFIARREVVSFDFNNGYSGEIQRVTMHPHLLKEYNNRWFVFGYNENASEKFKYRKTSNYPLDRIRGKVEYKVGIKYRMAPPDCYDNYFKKMVGVTRAKKGVDKQKVVIRTTDVKVHNLILTKPFHSSQEETQKFNGTEGEFTIELYPNIELQTKILSYGPGVYVAGDGPFETSIRKAVKEMMRYYSS